MNLELAKNKAVELMRLHKLDGWRFAYNNRKRAAGICSYRNRTIELSALLTQFADERDVLDTILHEIAHAMAGPSAGHGWEWQRIAKSIGCNGKRCFDEQTSTGLAYTMIAKYKAICPNGHEHFCNRLPKRRKACACGGRRFNEAFVLNFKPNI